MRAELLQRRAILKDLAPWPDPNYEIDESWAAAYPYASEVRNGERVMLQVKILNHARVPETYRLNWNIPPDWRLLEADNEVAISGRAEGAARAVFIANGVGLHVVTADVAFANRQLREWVEALVRVR